MAYLIKITIVWAIFLLLFELFYKNRTSFTANRICILLSIAAGLLLPLLPMPSIPLQHVGAVRDLYTITQDVPVPAGIPAPQSTGSAAIPATSGESGWNIVLIASIVYGAGAVLLFLKYLLELFKISILLRKNPVQLLYGYKIVSTGKPHSPYSFLSFIFLTDVASMPPKELEYIVRHEAAHHSRKHWLDLWILQLVHIIFWFHPLVWRYRYLLQLQHEYEADALVAGNDPYAYGRFILQQTMLRGVPAVTHSFHFSPIKNRINMLTKANYLKHSNRKYLLLIPVLLGCSLLSAKPADEGKAEIQGNKMYFNGNVLTWRSSDTLSYDKEKGKAEVLPANVRLKPQVVIGINDEPVFRNDYLQAQATYGNTATDFADYVREEFHKLTRNTIDSLTNLADLSIVVDKEGKVVYFKAHYARPQTASGQQDMWTSLYTGNAHADGLLDKIIAGSPLWKPARNNGSAVNSYVSVRFPGC